MRTATRANPHQVIPLPTDLQLLTSDDVAQMLKVSRQTLSNWRSARRGPEGVKLGRALRYRRSSVLAWIEAQADDRPAAT